MREALLASACRSSAHVEVLDPRKRVKLLIHSRFHGGWPAFATSYGCLQSSRKASILPSVRYHRTQPTLTRQPLRPPAGRGEGAAKAATKSVPCFSSCVRNEPHPRADPIVTASACRRERGHCSGTTWNTARHVCVQTVRGGSESGKAPCVRCVYSTTHARNSVEGYGVLQSSCHYDPG